MTTQGALSRLLFEPGASPHTFDANSERYEFLREDLSLHARHVGYNGIRGTRSRASERVSAATEWVAGRITMNVSPGDFKTLLLHIMGNESPSGTFNLADGLPYFGVMIDRHYGVFEYKDCKVNRAILSARAPRLGQEGEPDLLQLTLEIFGKTEDASATFPGSPPSLGTTGEYAPFVLAHADSNASPAGSVSLVAAEREIKDFDLEINNHLYVRAVNSISPTSICAQDRTIRLVARVPWESANSALYNQAVAGSAATLKFAYGAVSTTFTFGRLQVPRKSPNVLGKREVDLILTGEARSVGSTKELVVVNDATV